MDNMESADRISASLDAWRKDRSSENTLDVADSILCALTPTSRLAFETCFDKDADLIDIIGYYLESTIIVIEANVMRRAAFTGLVIGRTKRWIKSKINR